MVPGGWPGILRQVHLCRQRQNAPAGTGVDHEIGLAATIRRLIPIIKTLWCEPRHHIKLKLNPNSTYLPNDGVITFVSDCTKPANGLPVGIDHYALKKRGRSSCIRIGLRDSVLRKKRRRKQPADDYESVKSAGTKDWHRRASQMIGRTVAAQQVEV